jgi:hypothetical protein
VKSRRANAIPGPFLTTTAKKFSYGFSGRVRANGF